MRIFTGEVSMIRHQNLRLGWFGHYAGALYEAASQILTDPAEPAAIGASTLQPGA